jgi:hypothetical protein
MYYTEATRKFICESVQINYADVVKEIHVEKFSV